MTSIRDDLTVVIITKNEELNIGSIVESWRALAPVIVVDSNSWDNTAELAVRAGATVIKQDWLGFGKQKQFAIEAAPTDWVLSIDADEWPTRKLLLTLRDLPLNDHEIGFNLKRQSYFLGSRVNFCGWQNDKILRLFSKRTGHFDQRIVHEKVIHKGSTQTLSGLLLHHSYTRKSDIAKKVARYARLSATHALANGEITSLRLKAMFGPSWATFKILVLKAGFLDGVTGLRIARMNARTVARKYQLLNRLITHTRFSNTLSLKIYD